MEKEFRLRIIYKGKSIEMKLDIEYLKEFKKWLKNLI